MARSITLTLGVGLGADLGPNFNLTADVGSVTPSTATKIELLSPGKVVSVDDLATQVTVTSTGTCTNAITQTIPCAGGTTTTTTSTSTTTAAPGTTSTTTTIPIDPSIETGVTTTTVPTIKEIMSMVRSERFGSAFLFNDTVSFIWIDLVF